jgi:hypothetical protein
MKDKGDIVGYAVREVDGLQCWYKRGRHGEFGRGVFLDSSREKAKVYRTKQGATSVAELLNKCGFKYKDGTGYRFEVVPIFAV